MTTVFMSLNVAFNGNEKQNTLFNQIIEFQTSGIC